MKTTEQMVYEMIKENTGRHFLDSGGAYGRHWERNQKHPIEDFIKSKEVVMTSHIYRDGELELDVTISLFHHLVNSLNYDEAMDKLFHRFVDIYIRSFYEYWDEERNEGYGDFSWDKAIDCFSKLASNRRKDNHMYNYWEFEGENYSDYTYNMENNLSQDFVFDVVGSYAFIRTHNGCDARGGFSYPHLFMMKDEYNLIKVSDFTINCGNGHYWDFSGGYEETEQEQYLLTSNNKKGKYEVIDGDDADFLDMEEEYILQMKQWEADKRTLELSMPLPAMEMPTKVEPPSLIKNKILVKDGQVYCPVCGEILEAYKY